MWKQQVKACIARKDPETTINPPAQKNTTKRHFRVVHKKKKRGRPSETKEKNNKMKITKKISW